MCVWLVMGTPTVLIIHCKMTDERTRLTAPHDTNTISKARTISKIYYANLSSYQKVSYDKRNLRLELCT